MARACGVECGTGCSRSAVVDEMDADRSADVVLAVPRDLVERGAGEGSGCSDSCSAQAGGGACEEACGEEAGSGAVAILPVPLKAAAITGGSFSCAEQRWSFRLRVETTSVAPRQETNVVVAIDGADFPAKANWSPGVATVVVLL